MFNIYNPPKNKMCFAPVWSESSQGNNSNYIIANIGEKVKYDDY